MDYHKYEIMHDINLGNVQKGYENLNIADKRALLNEMKMYGFNIKDIANPQLGIISEVFDSGGGKQIKFGTSVNWYKKLGLIKEVI